jgi:HK97 family phage portal protein
MGFLTRSLGIQNFSLEDPAQPLLPYSALFESLGLGKSDAGVMVNEKQAMRLTTAFACINIISTDLSSLPFGVYQKLPDGSIREATEHRMYSILHDRPNNQMTAMVYWGAVLACALGWGNSYSLIRRDGAARAVSLHPLPSDRTNPALVEDSKSGKKKLIYITTATEDGMPAAIDPANVLHIPGLTMDGLVGLSPIGTCKNAFGLAIAAEKFGAQFFGNGARSSGVFKHPGELDAEAQENLKKSIREQMSGENALRPLVLEEGMTWEQTTIAPNDAQFLQTRQFQRSEIAALYRVAMHLLQDLQRATNNNIEHQSLDHQRYTLRPWAVRVEQEVDCKLLSGPYFSNFDFNEFQRGDFASQTAGLKTLFEIGHNSINDSRKALRQNPIPESEGGDVRMVPMNMVTLASLMEEPDPDAAKEEDADPDPGEVPVADRYRAPLVNSFRRLFRDAVGKIANRKQHDAQFAERTLRPILTSMGEAIVAMHLSGGLNESDQSTIAAHARDLAAKSTGWTRQNASSTATAVAEEAYTALKRQLIGEP